MARQRILVLAAIAVLVILRILIPLNVVWTSQAVVVDDGTLSDWDNLTVKFTDMIGDSPIDMTDLVFVAFDFDDTWLYVRWDIDNDGTNPAVLYDMGINITASGTTWDIFVAAQIERDKGTPVLTNISIRDAFDAHIWNASDDGNMTQDGTLYFDPPPGGTPGTISVEARFPLSYIASVTGLIFSQFRSHSSIQVTSNVKDVVPDAGYIVLSLDDDPPWLANLTDFPDPQSPGGNVNITVDAMDHFLVDTAWVNITLPNGSWLNSSMTHGIGNEWFLNTSYLDPGVYTYTAWANDSSNNWNSTGPGTFMITGDMVPPELANLMDTPDPQNPQGNVNITVDVTDSAAVGEVWVNITYPDGSWLNVSMSKGIGDEWYYNNTYLDLGVHSYTVWANDTSNNWNSSGPGGFTIQDDTPPELSNLGDAPDPQENGDFVNITVEVTDDVAVDQVWVNITYPDSSWNNVSMGPGAGDSMYFNTTYPDLGTYSYTVWANDTSDNWNFSGPGTFTIQDTDVPVLADLADDPDPQENGGYVNITVDVTDNVRVDEVWVNITYPDSGWLNVSMGKGSGDEWFYNTTYADPGIYSYTVWANDTSDNRNFIGPGDFTILDTDGPTLANLDDTPDPQEYGGYVNITVDATDDIGVNGVLVNITNPDGSWSNISMVKGTGNEWFYNTTYSDLGGFSYTVWGNDTSNNWDMIGPGTFTIQDTQAPELSNLTDTPDPQQMGGYVNITVEITDSVGIGDVWVNITFPDGTSINASMDPEAGDEWFFNSTFSDPGIYSYTVWANDTSDNWNFTGPGSFEIKGDISPPELANLDDTPDPQDPGGNVNITVDVTDDIAVDGVWANITNPNGTTINVSMTKGSGDQWFLNSSYIESGVYSYTVWANDTSNNWNFSGPATFTYTGDVNPPELSNPQDIPDPQNPGGNVNITVDVTDDYAVGAVWVNITCPNGTSINVSMNHGAGDEWFFNSTYQDPGIYSYIIWANDTGGNWNLSGPATFTIQDTDPPGFSNLIDAPDPQENNDYVNISVDVTDDMGVQRVWVNITYPDGSNQNVSMDKGPGDEWFFNSSYSDLGVYSYTIHADDINGNWNYTGPGTFTIQDTDPPELFDLNDAPDPQENGGAVNITVDVTDDVAVDEVWINITYPDLSWSNITMDKGVMDGWIYESMFNDLGVHSYTIWANDSSNNWNFTKSGFFTIQDTEGPEFSNVTASPNPQKDGGTVNITVDIWDDVGVDQVWVNITYPNGTSLNKTMQKGPGENWFYNMTYPDDGAYTYTIWANDTPGNWNFSGPRSFEIKTDIIPPLLLNATDFPDPQLPGGFVNITVEAVDDVALNVVLVNITYPDNTWVNISMIQGIGDKWFYNITYSLPGIHSYTIWANDTSDNREATAPGSFLIEDVTAPEFDKLIGLPNPQYDGGRVNITVDVTDNVEIGGVWLNISYPNGSWQNLSMNRGLGDAWFFNSTHFDLGTYSFRVWANDTSNNWNFTSVETFTIIDLEPPEILSIDDAPDPQENGGSVNITSTIFDNIGVDEVWVLVTYPNGTSLNSSMTFDSGNEWFFETNYPGLGVHTYTIWAKDTSGNWNSSGPGTITIQDTDGPVISDLLPSPDIQILGEYVNITCNVSDDVGVDYVWVNITFSDGTWQNASMIKGPDEKWYLNQSYSILGVHSYTVCANDTSNNWGLSGSETFEIIYIDLPPILWGILDFPDPQGVGGSVSITVNVADDIMVEEVWLNIINPIGVSVNMSMSPGAGYIWFYSSSYPLLHLYSYTVWAKDSGDNWNFSGPREFTILDITPPEFDNIVDTPDPQENDDYVNISVNVYDNVFVSEVWINIRHPDGVWNNKSMDYAGADKWYIIEPYPDLGLYIYSISASDSSSNWNTSISQSYIIHDTDGPDIVVQEDLTGIYTEDEEVVISFYVTDDIEVAYVWINIYLPDDKWINVSMERGKGNQWFYNSSLIDTGNYSYTIWAVDTSGNWNSSGPFLFTIEPYAVPPETPLLLYFLLLFVYWPLILIIFTISITKRYDFENRFSSDINQIASSMIKEYSKEPGKYKIGMKGLTDIIFLCEGTGIPPEEMVLTLLAAENLRFLLNGESSLLDDDVGMIMNTLKDKYLKKENG